MITHIYECDVCHESQTMIQPDVSNWSAIGENGDKWHLELKRFGGKDLCGDCQRKAVETIANG